MGLASCEGTWTPLPPPPPPPLANCRLFWSEDDRFLKQFTPGNLAGKFKPYSKFPPCYKDMAFWVSPEFTENNLCELVRGGCLGWCPHCLL
jgi:hypothetical protein